MREELRANDESWQDVFHAANQKAVEARRQLAKPPTQMNHQQRESFEGTDDDFYQGPASDNRGTLDTARDGAAIHGASEPLLFSPSF